MPIDFADKNWMSVNRFTNSPTAGRIAVSFTLFRSGYSPIQVCHSDDGGETWSTPVRVNDFADCAPEGLHAMAGGDGEIVCAWLDSRATGVSGVISSPTAALTAGYTRTSPHSPERSRVVPSARSNDREPCAAMAAASMSERGMLCKPAKKNKKLYEICFHTAAITIRAMAWSLLSSESHANPHWFSA